METVEHHGRETAYRRTGGEGPTTLAVHGSGGTHRVWAGQYGVGPFVAVDLSGHGESDDVATDPGEDTLTAYARDVVAVARETGADVLVGNSLGGAVVLETLLADRYDPAGVVLAGTGAKLTVAEPLREALSRDFDAAVEALHEPGRLFDDADPEVVERSREVMRGVGRAVTERDFLTCHRFDVRDRLGEVETPALALVGSNDGLTPVTYHEYLAEELPDCRLRVLDGAAHLAMVERPAAVADALREFREAVAR